MYSVHVFGQSLMRLEGGAKIISPLMFYNTITSVCFLTEYGWVQFFQMMKVKTHAFRQAHENIDNTLKAAEVVLTQFDVPRQVLIISN